MFTYLTAYDEKEKKRKKMMCLVMGQQVPIKFQNDSKEMIINECLHITHTHSSPYTQISFSIQFKIKTYLTRPLILTFYSF